MVILGCHKGYKGTFQDDKRITFPKLAWNLMKTPLQGQWSELGLLGVLCLLGAKIRSELQA